MLTCILAAGAAATADTTALAKRVTPAVVVIKGITVDGNHVVGSGFIVDSSGTVITNLHVIQELKSASIKLENGDIFDEIRVRAFDRRRDLAIIQVNGFKLPVVELGDSDTVQQGDAVALVGAPFDLESSFSSGVVSAIRSLDDGFRVIQTDASANPGNSGGPLVDANGRAIGVLSFKRRGSENLNFVVPINYARGLLATVRNVSLEELRGVLATSEDPLKATLVFPLRWKSLTTGTSRTIRIEGDFIYVELVLPDEVQKAGGFTITEFRKSGDKYVGTTRSRRPCTYPSSWDGSIQYNACSSELRTEITSLTPTRIEGNVLAPPDAAKLNCARCTYSMPPQRQEFVWIPELPQK